MGDFFRWLLVAKLMALTTILSVWGRPLQRWSRAYLDGYQLHMVLAVLLIVAGAGLVWMVRGRRVFWMIVVFVSAVLLFVQTGEEKIHCFLFGAMGFLAPKLWPVILFGAVDEVTQYYVPDRFFDWRDIALNVVSGWVGAIAGVSYRRRVNQSVTDS